MKHVTTRTLIVFALIPAALALVGCSNLKPRHAPFHVFNSSLLNGEPESAFPRGPLGEEAPLEPVAYRDESPVQDATMGKGVEVASAETLSAPRRSEDSEARSRPKKAPSSTRGAEGSKRADKKVKTLEPPKHYTPQDAASYIGAICKMNGVSVDVGADGNAIAELYSTIKERGRIYHATRPAVGDVMFFHNTYDRNGDARNNDWYTHVGVVEGVDEDGTIRLLSYWGGRVQSSVVNLEHPEFERNEKSGKLWNSTLRDKRAGEPAFTQHLGSELFAGFGNLLGNRTEFIVIDNWVPGMVVGKL